MQKPWIARCAMAGSMAKRPAFDEQYWLQKFTPRRPKSGWSKINCDKVTALIAQGRMQSAGMRQVELAKADGRWESAYQSQSKITVPPDFQSELDKNPQAKEFFSTLNSINRYAILRESKPPKNPKPALLASEIYRHAFEKQENIPLAQG